MAYRPSISFTLCLAAAGTGILILGWKVSHMSMVNPKDHRTRSDIQALKQGIESFSAKYGRLPRTASSDNELRTNSTAGVELLTVLLGEEEPGSDIQNPERILFTAFTKVNNKRFGGLAYDDPRPGAPPQGLYDVWGQPLRVIIRSPEASELLFTYGGRPVVLKNTSVAVVSSGPDGQEGTSDDIHTW